MISAIGFDTAKHDEAVSVEIVNPMASAAAPSAQGPPDVVFYASAPSITDALLTIQREAPGDLDLSGTQVIVVSEGLLRKGISPIVSFVMRPSNGRLAAWVVASTGTARGLLSVPIASTASTPFFQIYDVESFVAERRPLIVRTPLWKVYRAQYTPWLGTIIPLISDTGKKIEFRGGALLADGRLTGQLSSTETAIVTMLSQGDAGLRLSTLVDGAMVSIDVSHVNLHMAVTPRLQGRLSLTVHGLIAEDGRGFSAAHNPAWQRTVQEAFAVYLDRELNVTIDHLERAHDDVIGFGERLRAEDPRLWTHVSNRWSAVFAKMPVAISVAVKVSSPGP
jgi:Ger(x)C family germination protein